MQACIKLYWGLVLKWFCTASLLKGRTASYYLLSVCVWRGKAIVWLCKKWQKTPQEWECAGCAALYGGAVAEWALRGVVLQWTQSLESCVCVFGTGCTLPRWVGVRVEAICPTSSCWAACLGLALPWSVVFRGEPGGEGWCCFKRPWSVVFRGEPGGEGCCCLRRRGEARHFPFFFGNFPLNCVPVLSQPLHPAVLEAISNWLQTGSANNS